MNSNSLLFLFNFNQTLYQRNGLIPNIMLDEENPEESNENIYNALNSNNFTITKDLRQKYKNFFEGPNEQFMSCWVNNESI